MIAPPFERLSLSLDFRQDKPSQLYDRGLVPWPEWHDAAPLSGQLPRGVLGRASGTQAASCDFERSETAATGPVVGGVGGRSR